MGQSLGLLTGVAGAAIGGFFGGPMGAQAGFLAGNMLGTLLTPRKTPSPADVRVQDSAYGKWVPRVWGRYRLSGNVIWAGAPHQHDQSGKGMGGKQGQPYVTMSFAVALCKGPITSVPRIWANGQLIYDLSNPADFQALSGSSSMVTNFTVYYGTETQLPDPVMQSQLGAGNVPAHRGMAYVVFNELSLQNWGNYMPSLSFEVVANGVPTYVTSGNVAATQSPALGSGALTLLSQISPGGQGYGIQWALVGGQIRWVPVTVTGSGTSFLSSSATPMGSNFPVTTGTSYDEPGYVWTDGTWRPTQGSPGAFGATLPVSALSSGSWVKRNGVIFYTDTTGLSKRPIFKVNNLMSLTSLAVGSLVSSGNFSASMVIIACSDDYVYAVGADASDATYGNRLIQADHDGNFVAILAGPDSTLFSATTRGYCVSDSELYINAASGFVYLWNGSSLANTGMPGDSSGNLTSMRVVSNQLAYFSDNVHGKELYAVVLSATQPAPTIASIASDVCASANLQPTQYDVTQLTDTVQGYGQTSNSSPRDILAPLMSAYFFDAVDSDGLIKFVRRGGATALTIPLEDLGAASGSAGHDGANPVTSTIQQEQELPQAVALTYMSASTDYQTAVQREPKANTTSTLQEPVNLPAVVSDNEARQRVQSLLWERWVKRQSFQFSTQFKYLALEPADVVQVPNLSGGFYTLRITKVSNDGKGTLSFQADPSVPSLYPNPSTSVTDMPQGTLSLGFSGGQLPYSGQTVLQVMDLPPLRNGDTSPGLYVAACGLADNWPGCNVDISRDGSSYSQLLSVTSASVMGYATTALGAFSGGNQPDELNSFTVTLYDPNMELSSVSYQDMLNGVNACLLGDELLYFRTATLVSAGTYAVSGLVRGRQNTGAAQSTHSVGDRFVLLSTAATQQVAVNTTDVGRTLYFEPFLLNLFGNQPGDVRIVTPANARVRPFSPHLLTATKGSAASAQDITVRWFRAARVNSQLVSGADVPLDQSAENYTLTVYNASGASVRTATVAGPFTAPAQPTYTYTAANIAADGFTTGSQITISVQQNSDLGVLGLAASVTTTR